MPEPITQILHGIYYAGSKRESIAVIYHYCLDRLEERNYEAIGELMMYLDTDMLPYSVILAPLCITVLMKNKVPKRDMYYNRLHTIFSRECPERADKLLEGLK